MMKSKCTSFGLRTLAIVESFLRMLPVFLVAVAALVLSAAASEANVIELEDAEVIIEINATDGDAGFHTFVDGEAWYKMKLRAPNGRIILEVNTSRNLRRQGLVEWFFESDEPGFDEQPIEEFLSRFSEGTYTFHGRTSKGDRLVGEAKLTHNLPAGPEITSPTEGQVVDPDSDLIVEWEEVTEDFRGGALDSPIVRYQLAVEFEDKESDPPGKEVLTIDVPPDEFSASIPAEFLKPGREYKVEVGAREKSGNQTFTETTFTTAPL